MIDAHEVQDVNSEQAIGPIIRKRRKRLGMTLQELCDQVGLSVGYLSQVERDNATPSLGTLAQISQALGVQMQYFIAVPNAADRLSRAENRSTFSINGSDYTYEALSSNIPGAELSSYILHIPPHYQSEITKHDGEEIFYVLEGELIHTLGGEDIKMQKGDSLHFNGDIPHSWMNPTNRMTSVVWTGTLEVLQSGVTNLNKKP